MTFRRVFRILAAAAVLAAAGPGRAADTTADPVTARMKKDIFFLAGEECNGRGVGTPGIDKAADYVAARFKEAGLRPGGRDGGFFQPFGVGAPKLGTPTRLRLSGPEAQAIEARFGTEFLPTGLSAEGTVTADLVFAGYGISTPAYDDYAGLDVRGKVVVVLRRTPRADNEKDPFAPGDKGLGALNTKVETAEKHGAAGVIFVNDRTYAKDKDELIDYRRAGAPAARIPVLHMKRGLVEHLFAGRDKTLAGIEEAIDKDLTPRSCPLAGWTAAAEVTLTRTTAKNVVGVLPGSGPLADETVVIGAHYDHLGTSSFGSLLGTAGEGKVHFGADDNASGTTGLIELARRFGAMNDRVGRRLVFIAFSGEERGLLGSMHYCREPLFPLEKTVFMLNMDMIGRMKAVKDGAAEKGRLVVYGHGTADGLEAVVDEANRAGGFKLFKLPGGSGPSDHDSFYRKKIPVLFLFTGTHPDYHRPSDTPDKINVAGMRQVTDLAERLAAHFATAPDRPTYRETKDRWRDPTEDKPVHDAAVGGKMPKLRLLPDYTADEEGKGMRVEAVTAGGPAEKGGLKAGDLIVEFAGKPVKNATQYTNVLSSLKPGKQVEVVVLRDGNRVTLKVTPVE